MLKYYYRLGMYKSECAFTKRILVIYRRMWEKKIKLVDYYGDRVNDITS